MKRAFHLIFLVVVMGVCAFGSTRAEDLDMTTDTNAALRPMGLRVEIDPANSPGEVTQSIKILLLLTLLSLAPSAIIMTTSFTRILIVLGFLRHAMGTQQTPPATVLTGMALFLTIFVMGPVWKKINTEAIQPYMAEQITGEEAWNRGATPLKTFMEKQTGQAELALFIDLSGAKSEKAATEPSSLTEDDQQKEAKADIPMEALIPAFMISELKTAFQLGFLIYLPFLVIDLVIASSLMSLGMMMLPPMMISLPVKILFFVLADGWTLLIRGVVSSFAV